jgi:hyaluronoglucosaminidase
MRGIWSLVAVAGVAASLCGTAIPAQAARADPALPAAARAGRAARPVWPTPQQPQVRTGGFQVPRTVGLVTAAGTDGPALRVVRAVLRKAGATDIRESPADPHTRVTVWLTGGRPVLKALHVADHTGLAAEGYVLAAGLIAGRAHIVLDGADGAGSFYAAETLGQLVSGRWMPGVAIRDWPSMRYRGSIEGFYGTPWSHADRLDHLDYLGAHKMNTYEYAPKDDPYHRERWRDPYPPDRLAQLGELVARSRDDHVEFTFALSPGVSICYSSESDLTALLAKFDAIYRLGGRSFNVPFDDIAYGTWNCPADRAAFGDGAAAAGRAQAYVLNKVAAWARAQGDVHPLQTVPTEYYDVADSPYKQVVRAELDPDVIVHWTGAGVVPTTITVDQAAQAREVFGHQILSWDNYPVNDYIAGRLPLAAYTGREPGLSRQLAGIISNPSNQAAVSKVALFSFADFGWHDATYDAQRAWSAALSERAGGDRRTIAALRAFADVSTYDGTLHRAQAPELAAATSAFWRRWNGGDHRGAIGALRPRVRALAAAPAAIRAGGTDPAFADQAKAWLDATGLWADAMDAALDMLGDPPEKALADRRRIAVLVARATAIRDTRDPHTGTAPKIGDGVIDTFLATAKTTFDRSVGVQPQRPAAVTSLSSYQDNVPERMADGDLGTYFWSNGPPGAGDWVGVDFGDPRPIGDVAVLMGKSGSPTDYVHAGTLEYSADGASWTTLTTGTTAEVRATAPAGATARFVRYRATADNDGYWCVVREFQVSVPGQVHYMVTGGPAGDLAAAADGSLDTAYTAVAPPAAGDALVVTPSAVQRLDRIRVLGSAGSAHVEAHAEGGWRHVGKLRDGYADLRAAGLTADAVRLSWDAGSPVPSISEVVLVAASTSAGDNG